MDVIKINNITKKFDELVAVNNLSLNVNKGEIVGFVGKNGAGKSTTIRCILNMLNSDEGDILVLGLDSKKDSKKIKEKVSYVPSDITFYNNINGYDLLEFVISITKKDKKEIDKLAKYFEINLNKKVSELSFGNQKKLILISAFLKDYDLMILDEPTNGLDPLMQNKFFDLILKEKEKGKTIFLSSHNLSEIEKYCDKVAIIKDGILVDYINMKDIVLNKKQIITYETIDGKVVNKEIKEDINKIIKDLSKLKLKSLEIKYKSIDEEFLEYYGGKESV